MLALAAGLLPGTAEAATPPAVHTLVPTASAVFKDGAKGEKIHIASGFVCPERIGRYIRDSVGESDLESRSDFCSYYGFDGVYGTVTLTPLRGTYDPAQSLSSEFIQQEGIGAKQVGEKTFELGPKNARIKVFSRTYETSHLETLHYRLEYTGATVKGWIVETTTEYAEPRDDALHQSFLDWAYGEALNTLNQAPPPATAQNSGAQ